MMFTSEFGYDLFLFVLVLFCKRPLWLLDCEIWQLVFIFFGRKIIYLDGRSQGGFEIETEMYHNYEGLFFTVCFLGH